MTGNEGIVLAEEAALKKRLTGITVSSVKEGTDAVEVPVYYRFPEGERRAVEFPLITIDFLDMAFAADRAESGLNVMLDYRPSEEGGLNEDTNLPAIVSEWPVPLDLTYQISSWCRSPRQDRQLLGKLIKKDRLPPRRGWLHLPEDGTYRRLDVLSSWQATDFLDDRGFTVHRKTTTIRINTELLPADVEVVRTQRVILSETFGTPPDIYGIINVY